MLFFSIKYVSAQLSSGTQFDSWGLLSYNIISIIAATANIAIANTIIWNILYDCYSNYATYPKISYYYFCVDIHQCV